MSPMFEYEVQHLIGRRIVNSTKITAKDMGEADKLSKAWRKEHGATRYRIVKCTAGRARHGGFHQTAWVFGNH